MKNNIRNKINNKGVLSIEMVVIVGIFTPIILSLLIGSYFFFQTQTNNINTNFDAGRYASVTGCSHEKLSSMSTLQKYENFDITVFEDNREYTISSNNKPNSIVFVCGIGSHRGSEFRVVSTMEVKDLTLIDFFPNETTRVGIYTQEAK